MSYDFRSLLPADFEDLARDLAEKVFRRRFEAFGAGPDGGMDGRHASAAGDFILQAKHMVDSPFATLKRTMKRERLAIDKLAPHRYAELEIDHVVPIAITSDDLARLKREKIISDDFDLNGLGNLLPTKRFPNGGKSDRVRPNSVLIHFLDVARQHRPAIETQLAAAIDDRKTLTAYLELRAKAKRNSIEVEDVVDVHRQQEGSTRLRHTPELAGTGEVTLLNAALARALMSKPFALGGGTIDPVALRDDDGDTAICTNCVEFLAAQKKGYWPDTQFDMTCYGMAERNCVMLAALETATFAPVSAIRYPRITCRNLDRWSSAWVRQAWIEFDAEKDGPLFDRCPTIADLVAAGSCTIVEQDDWRAVIEPDGGFGLALSELFRADLDGDGEEEILVFDLLYATGGTLRAGSVGIAKPDADGILQPVIDAPDTDATGR